ncbi:MAG: hypothetical protein HY347_12515 [candidate division NC10 bacterium]|nr:hypothetical protein [candidate division NC10 bacterium]
MPSRSKGIFKRWKASFLHAFAVDPEREGWFPEEVALMEGIAERLVRRRMAASAIMFLESMGPLSFLGSQALHMLNPLLGVVCDQMELERAARILERRDSIPFFIQLLERKEREREGR